MNYEPLDRELKKFIKVLSTPTPEGHLYVPMPTTVWLLRRLNAICAQNMIETDFQVGEEDRSAQRLSRIEVKRAPKRRAP